MVDITNDDDFRKVISGMDDSGQRALAARFLENVLALSDDERIARVAQVAARPDASADELVSALHTARTATVDHHNRCGAECNWKDQAGYFVARAALAAVSAQDQVAMSSRMAKTCKSIDTAEDTSSQDRQEQYRILSEFINS